MEKRRKIRAKASHGKYGERKQRVQAEVSQDAKQGLQRLALELGVSLNEYLELLGRGQISLPSLPGEF